MGSLFVLTADPKLPKNVFLCSTKRLLFLRLTCLPSSEPLRNSSTEAPLRLAWGESYPSSSSSEFNECRALLLSLKMFLLSTCNRASAFQQPSWSSTSLFNSTNQWTHPVVWGAPLRCLAGHSTSHWVRNGHSLRLRQDPLRGGWAPALYVRGLQCVSRVRRGR